MPTIDFQSIPSGISPSEERIDQMHRSATELSQAFSRRLAKIMETFDEARQRYNADAEGLTASATDPADRRLIQQIAKQRLAQQVLDFRMNLVRSSEPERADMLRQLKALADEAEQVAALHASPVQFLGRFALGDSRRLNIQQTLAEAGPTELESAARQAIMTNDLPMAAAVVTVVDRRPKDRRPFSAADFAARVVGIVHADILRKLKAVDVAFQSAFAAEREFVRGKPDPHTNIALALARQGLAQAEGAGA